MKKSVLVFCGFYTPGFKGGGPSKTIANTIDSLGDEFRFSVITSDRDLGDEEPYARIKANCWNKLGKADVFYLQPKSIGLVRLIREMRKFPDDLLYLNSFFSFWFSILPLIIGYVTSPNRTVILGPRGELSKGALALKSFKKRFFIVLAKSSRLYGKVVWLASTSHEAEDIRRVMGDSIRVRTAIDISLPKAQLVLARRVAGTPLRIVFLSRLSPMKNLLFGIKVLHQARVPVVFDVYGPIEDGEYWRTCLDAAGALPSNVQFNYRGSLYPAEVPDKLATYDLFFLPTLGENFGHVIAEALSSGLPVLISDTTLWRNLQEARLGWDLPLDRPDDFVACVEHCFNIPAAEYDAWRQEIRAWALAHVGDEDSVEQNRRLFLDMECVNER